MGVFQEPWAAPSATLICRNGFIDIYAELLANAIFEHNAIGGICLAQATSSPVLLPGTLQLKRSCHESQMQSKVKQDRCHPWSLHRYRVFIDLLYP